MASQTNGPAHVDLAPYKGYGFEVLVGRREGPVLDIEQSSETQVYSVGGSPGYNGQSSTPPSIHSRTSHRQRIWYKRGDKECWMEATNCNLRFRPGHLLQLLVAKPPNGDWLPVWVRNQATREEWWLHDGAAIADFHLTPLVLRLAWMAFKAWVLFVILCWPYSSIPPSSQGTYAVAIFAAAGIYAVTLLIRDRMRVNAMRRSIQFHLSTAIKTFAEPA